MNSKTIRCADAGFLCSENDSAKRAWVSPQGKRYKFCDAHLKRWLKMQPKEMRSLDEVAQKLGWVLATAKSVVKCCKCGRPAHDDCKFCNNCCVRGDCAACGIKHVLLICSKHCEACCSCKKCPSCATESPEPLCVGCNTCLRCCRCQFVHDIHIGDPIPTLPSDMKVFKSRRTVGVEWEFNSVTNAKPLNDALYKWACGMHQDGSCGWEAVTSMLGGDNIDKCLKELGTAFEQGNVQLDSRCGLHVHVNASDLYWRDIIRVVYLYSVLEPLLYMIGGQDRAIGQFSKACGKQFLAALRSKTDQQGELLAEIFSAGRRGQVTTDRGGRDAMRARPGKKDAARYRGLNLMPWLSGRRNKTSTDLTIEFRLHRGTKDAKLVSSWAQFCCALVNYANAHTERELMALPKSPLKIAALVAPHLKPWLLKAVKDYRKRYKRSHRMISVKNNWSIK